jgi:hypothetical protein
LTVTKSSVRTSTIDERIDHEVLPEQHQRDRRHRQHHVLAMSRRRGEPRVELGPRRHMLAGREERDRDREQQDQDDPDPVLGARR